MAAIKNFATRMLPRVSLRYREMLPLRVQYSWVHLAAMASQWMDRLPISYLRLVAQKIQVFEDSIRGMISEVRSEGVDPSRRDILSLLVGASLKETGEGGLTGDELCKLPKCLM